MTQRETHRMKPSVLIQAACPLLLLSPLLPLGRAVTAPFIDRAYHFLFMFSDSSLYDIFIPLQKNSLRYTEKGKVSCEYIQHALAFNLFPWRSGNMSRSKPVCSKNSRMGWTLVAELEHHSTGFILIHKPTWGDCCTNQSKKNLLLRIQSFLEHCECFLTTALHSYFPFKNTVCLSNECVNVVGLTSSERWWANAWYHQV